MAISNLLLLLLLTPALITSLSIPIDQQRSRLQESLKSLSGKLTLSPELEILDPTDPTALLLQSSALQSLSGQLRVDAKANALFVSASTTAIQTLCNEQDLAQGSFPGPLPLIYCGDEQQWSELAEAGVCGVVISCSQDQLESVLAPATKQALEAGLQPIPEILVTKPWSDENQMQELTDQVTSIMGQEPAAVMVTLDIDEESDDDIEDTEDEIPVSPLPPVPKTLAKKLPILGSIRVLAGQGRMSFETQRFKDAGYTGCVLKASCLPPVAQKDVDLMTRFWTSCIADLKSTRSKSFQFRSKNFLNKSAALEWAKYSNSVVESGALGLPEQSTSVNADQGDYQGF